MPSTTPTPAPGAQLLPADRLEEIDTILYHFEHTCALISAFASQGEAVFTDGLRLEMYAVVFGWIGDELHDVRLSLNTLQQELSQSC